ncbi:MAG: metallophosphoesterase [Spirochaetota bacterium]
MSIDYARLDHEHKLKLALQKMQSMDTNIRPLNSSGIPGGLVKFSPNEKREFIIVGDLHANKRNLKAILQDSGNLYRLEEDQAVMVFLGDIVHDERTGHLKEMHSSIQAMDIVIHLINKYPHNIIYLKGNHDTFDPRLSKNSIQQGLEHMNALIEQWGAEYAELMEQFVESLPVMGVHPYFLAAHAGPVRGGITRGELINIDHYPGSKHQLIWNRINETRTTPNQKEYGPEDLDAQRYALNRAGNTPFFVGHNPIWHSGGKDSVWVEPLQIHDYVILYSGAQNVCHYISIRRSKRYCIKYANLKLKKKRFVLE